jgi:hypothetical protein
MLTGFSFLLQNPNKMAQFTILSHFLISIFPQPEKLRLYTPNQTLFGSLAEK